MSTILEPRSRRLARFVRERFPLENLDPKHMIEKKEVPRHRMSWAYYMGGLALFFLLVQIVTGLLLLFYYQPTVSDAHASVETISEYVSGGAWIRNLHAWSSSAMIATVIVHLFTTFAMKAFAAPRELTWVSGVSLALIVFGFGFTGYLLPWNQIAVNATKVGLQSVEAVGQYLPGEMAHWPTFVRETIQGEPSVGQATLSRFFAIHVIVLPLLTIAALGVHLMQVQLHGMSRGVDALKVKTEKFFPFFVIKDLSVWGVAFFVVAVVAMCLPFDSFLPFPLLEPYNPLGSTPDGIKPEWYFFFVYYPLELLPYWAVIAASTLVLGALFLAPWIFARTTRRTLSALAIAAALYFVVMTVFGHAIYDALKGGPP
ncbi:MAG: cytochrome b N-terminal domain-containing protein [Planctomycetota bacterium]|nr:cytochrome b N-terminal domain-containing protein [Planctomycetota bacterium]